jgi:hypothetical protein
VRPFFTPGEDERRSVVRATPLAINGGPLVCAEDTSPEARFAPLRAELTPVLRGGTRPEERTG